jgi:hypothetical protein
VNSRIELKYEMTLHENILTKNTLTHQLWIDPI